MTELAQAAGVAAPPADRFAVLRRNGMWLAAALLFAALPLVVRSGSALTMLSLMGIMIVFALSYNMLLGQTGMLSFGHAEIGRAHV